MPKPLISKCPTCEVWYPTVSLTVWSDNKHGRMWYCSLVCLQGARKLKERSDY